MFAYQAMHHVASYLDVDILSHRPGQKNARSSRRETKRRMNCQEAPSAQNWRQTSKGSTHRKNMVQSQIIHKHHIYSDFDQRIITRIQ